VMVDLNVLWNQMGYLTSVSVPPTVCPNSDLPAIVTLDHPAPLGTMPVQMISDSPGIVPPQSLLAVPEGLSTKTFMLPVRGGGKPATVTLTFTVNGLAKSVTTSVQAACSESQLPTSKDTHDN
jgi:hypothetical protein